MDVSARLQNKSFPASCIGRKRLQNVQKTKTRAKTKKKCSFCLLLCKCTTFGVAIFSLCLPRLHTDFYGAASLVSITVRFMISRNDEKLNKNLFFFSGGA